MIYLLLPLIAAAVVGLVCLNYKIGFIVADATYRTGFHVGFCAMTVAGLIVAELCLATYLVEVFK